ncbi:MAG TPA: RluA family pseudouridine synthase [Rectinemataceae bacterium]|nr:RluA family pseudouridine synthase [Rectinemataceae bacterium]
MIPSLYQDEDILVLDKPAGLASQPGAGIRLSLIEVVERDFGFRPFPVHRLDRETAGCIMVARSSRAASRWAALVESRELRKIYRAVVAGEPRGVRGHFDENIPSRRGELSASTSWRLLGGFGAREAGEPRPFAYLELELATGRTHQIRLHLAQAGLPILGDDRHGDFRLNKRLRTEAGLKRLLLLAYELVLPDGRRLHASMPPHFTDFMGRFGDSPDAETP